ncbi:MAG TPA: Ni/Fe hydrogenase subunit gamma [Verrucomicrobiales bacterium]|nr:Ni/Fe hydrogenase subunit gamma [Verrucomicrobiales bacterium]
MVNAPDIAPRGTLADPLLPEPWRIAAVRKETADTFTLSLEPVNGAGGRAFAAGQFNMLYVFGVGEVPISICGNPLEPAPLQHTTRAVGNVTRAMWKLKAGDVIGVRGPFGSSWPVGQAAGRDVVIVAGGIGLAPLRALFHHVLGRRQEFGRVALLYGARTPEDLLYHTELRGWARRRDLDVHLIVDRATGNWQGNVGVVTTLVGRAPFEPKNAVAFVCGPEVMMRFVALELRKRGVPEPQIFLSLERNMKCATGFCGHCQFGPEFICKTGPVFRHDRVKPLMNVREL